MVLAHSARAVFPRVSGSLAGHNRALGPEAETHAKCGFTGIMVRI